MMFTPTCILYVYMYFVYKIAALVDTAPTAHRCVDTVWSTLLVTSPVCAPTVVYLDGGDAGVWKVGERERESLCMSLQLLLDFLYHMGSYTLKSNLKVQRGSSRPRVEAHRG